MNKQYLVIRSNYIIGIITWDGSTPYNYPDPYDQLIEDIWEYVNIGDWYESAEGVFYRPLTTPPDYPPA